MSVDPNVLVGFASLAGVFVGFGALISAVRSGEMEPPQIGLIRLLVTLSLMTIVASLAPLVVANYGLDAHEIWTVSSLIFLALLGVVIALAVTSPNYRRTLIGQVRRSRTRAVAFWVVRVMLWAAMLGPLALILLAANPEVDAALYLTALTFALLEASFILAQVVFAQVADADD